MSTKITIYTKPACQPCRSTKRLLNGLGAEFTESPIDDEVREIAREKGITSAPIIHIENASGDLWESGFKPELLRAVVQDEFYPW